jgi:hypothetical protein
VDERRRTRPWTARTAWTAKAATAVLLIALQLGPGGTAVAKGCEEDCETTTTTAPSTTTTEPPTTTTTHAPTTTTTERPATTTTTTRPRSTTTTEPPTTTTTTRTRDRDDPPVPPRTTSTTAPPTTTTQEPTTTTTEAPPTPETVVPSGPSVTAPLFPVSAAPPPAAPPEPPRFARPHPTSTDRAATAGLLTPLSLLVPRIDPIAELGTPAEPPVADVAVTLPTLPTQATIRFDGTLVEDRPGPIDRTATWLWISGVALGGLLVLTVVRSRWFRIRFR